MIATPSVCGIALKYISLVILTLQNSCLITVMVLAQSPGRPPFFSSTAVFVCELVKLLVCIVLTIHETIHDTGRFYPWDFIRDIFGGDAWKLSIPAMLYAIQNNLQYVAAHALDPSTFQVTYQLKILTTALFSVLLLHRVLRALKWMSLVMLTIGIGLVSVEVSKNSTAQKAAVDHIGTLQETAAVTNTRPDVIVGLLVTLMACVLSGLAGVYFEKVLKTTEGSLWLRNIQLSLFSLPFALLAVFLKDGNGVAEKGFFVGYDWVIIAAIACQSAGGLIVAVVVKYADNILKGFATSISIIISVFISVYLFQSTIGSVSLVGIALVLVATYLYSQPDKAIVK
ncbi:hypothetical protein BGZ59_005311 [Podila verticillata]|nr:hypothetical protein BGZ59_005311 [Podila verticillata]